MKLIVIGVGQGGSNIADEFVALGRWVYNNRERMRIFSGKEGERGVSRGVFAVNLADSDLRGLRNIPTTEDYCVLLGTQDEEFSGRGAGKVNSDGARQARAGAGRILDTVQGNSDVSGADAILVIATTAGGTGSGAVGVIVDVLKGKYPTKPVYAMLVLPFRQDYEGDNIDQDAVINTATCLRRVIEKSQADGVFLIDNQKLLESDTTSGDALAGINKRIVDAFMDILCVGEETKREYIGEVLDANDVIRSIEGISAIGIGHIPVPKSSVLDVFGRRGPKDISVTRDRNNRARNVVQSALNDLSVHCEHKTMGGMRYNAKKALVLLSGPENEVTHGALEIAKRLLAEQAPGASPKAGTYPGRTSNSISATVILSGIDKGAVMDLVQMFYERAKSSISRNSQRRKASRSNWAKVSKAGEGLPDL